MKEQLTSVINKASTFVFKHIGPAFGLDGTKIPYFGAGGPLTQEEYKMISEWTESLSPEELKKYNRISKISNRVTISFVLLITIGILVALIIFYVK
ncbi:MAG: hypothetical protein R3B53_04790 [Candidatus Paceibacterota bacterium]